MADEPRLQKGNARTLTFAEEELARTIFGSSIDYNAVRIHRGGYTRFQGDNTTVTPNGNLYCPDGTYCDDFSKGSRSHFIHEMTHVWQYQNKVLDPRVAAAGEFIRTGGDYGQSYSYKPDPAKDFLDYGLEQQAEMVEWYFGYRERLAAGPAQPPQPATPEELEKGMFMSLRLKALTEARQKNPDDPAVRSITGMGLIAFDKDGVAHVTQKYADQITEQRKADAIEEKKRADDTLQVMRKFIVDPSYVDPAKPMAFPPEHFTQLRRIGIAPG
jgi:hypothetical protein